MTTRGGEQPIPRPHSHRPGNEAPWQDVPLRDLTLASVKSVLGDLPPPQPPPLDVADSRESAVLVPLVERAGETHVVFTKRPETLAAHPGEISFPGGRREPADPDLVTTALREAEEEIGLGRALVEVVGELDRMATIASRFVIFPYVGAIRALPVLRLDPFEVESVLIVPLSVLLDPETYREERWDMSAVRPEWSERAVHFYELPAADYTHHRGETIWGATARILTRLLEHVTGTKVDAPPAIG